MSSKLKNGQMSVVLEKEEIIWKDRKRTVFLGLPWSFQRYSMTPSRLFLEAGFFKRVEEEIRLYRVTDVAFTQTFGERLAGLGTVCIRSSDQTTPVVHLTHIKKAKTVKNVISQYVEIARKENGVRTSEIVGGHTPGAPGEHHPSEGGDSVGPEIMPDFNHNGIDDRTEV